VQSKKPAKRSVNRGISFTNPLAGQHWDPVLDATLDRFEKRQTSLLASLKDAHRRGSDDKSFDEKGALDNLRKFACLYIAMSVARKCRRPSPDIRERFNRLVIDMERVRRLLKELMNSNEFKYVSNAEQRIEADAMHGVIAVQYSAGVLGAVVGRRGRPHDRALWPGEVEHLAELHAKSTGLMPGRGRGPFARWSTQNGRKRPVAEGVRTTFALPEPPSKGFEMMLRARSRS
jgi:hypothetical protein